MVLREREADLVVGMAGVRGLSVDPLLASFLSFLVVCRLCFVSIVTMHAVMIKIDVITTFSHGALLPLSLAPKVWTRQRRRSRLFTM